MKANCSLGYRHRIASVCARARGPDAPCGIAAVAVINAGQHRIAGIGNRRGVVGQRHHLALVFELAHVQQVVTCSKNTPGDAGRGGGDRSSARRETRETVADMPSPTPSMVTTVQTSKPRRRPPRRMALVWSKISSRGVGEAGGASSRAQRASG